MPTELALRIYSHVLSQRDNREFSVGIYIDHRKNHSYEGTLDTLEIDGLDGVTESELEQHLISLCENNMVERIDDESTDAIVRYRFAIDIVEIAKAKKKCQQRNQ